VTWRNGIVAAGAREVDDDLGLVFVFGMEFVLDGGEGAQDQIAGVGHDGGAARGDAVFGLKMQEAGEELVDGDSGLEFGEAGGEGGGEIDGCVFMLGELRVGATEEGLRVRDEEAAAGAVDEAMPTTR